MGSECNERMAEMEEGFKAFLAFQASPAYQTFLQWSQGQEEGTQLAESPLAAPADAISDGDTAWMLMATTLVLFMTIPGQTIFFAGQAHPNILFRKSFCNFLDLRDGSH